jgi:hypothetical protein
MMAWMVMSRRSTPVAIVMQQSPRFPLLRKIDQSAPSKHFMKLSEGLPRRHSSLLFQLRTGHTPLNKYLHRIAKVPSPTCQKCHLREESVHHFLIVCPAYARQRHELQNEIAPRASHLKNLLNDRKCIKPLFRFIANTRRLEQTFGDVTPPVTTTTERHPCTNPIAFSWP